MKKRALRMGSISSPVSTPAGSGQLAPAGGADEEAPGDAGTSRKKILMLCAQIGYGGAEKSFVRLANFLSLHHDVTVALFARDYGGTYHQEGAEHLTCPVVILEGLEVGQPARWIRRWRHFRALKRQSDAAISFMSGPNLLNAMCAGDVPTLISVRGSKRYETEGSALRRFVWKHLLDRFANKRASRIVTASAGLAGEILEGHERSLGHKVVPVEGSIDSEFLVRSAEGPIEADLEPLAGHPTVVACGRLHEQKGFQYLIPAFADVVAAVPRAKLLIIGDGPELASLEMLASGVGLKATCEPREVAEADILFAGYRKDPARYFRLGRVFAFSSLYEGLPNALIEALASGVPILAADCPWGARSVLGGSAEGGLLAEHDLPLELPYGTLMPRLQSEGARSVWSERIADALTNPTPRRARDERLSAIARFDLRTTGRIWLQVIEEVTRTARGGPGLVRPNGKAQESIS